MKLVILLCSTVVLAANAQTNYAPRPVQVSAEIMAAQLVAGPSPVGASFAKSGKTPNIVVVQAIIGDNGTIENMSVVSGPENLRGAAVDALRQWIWKPYVKDGRPVAVDTTVAVDFNAPSAIGQRSRLQTAEVQPAAFVASDRTGTRVKPNVPVHIAGGVMAGNLLTRSRPVYPAGVDAGGVLQFHAIIDTDGLVSHLEVISGPVALRAATMDAVRRWTYKPYLLDGAPVEVDTTITFEVR